MNQLLTWLWFKGLHDSWRVVKAFDWTEMLVDDKYGSRRHVAIVCPEWWILNRIGWGKFKLFAKFHRILKESA